MSATEELAAVKAMTELTEMLGDGANAVGSLLKELDGSAQDPAVTYRVLAKLTEMSEDEIACIAIVALFGLSKLRLRTRGTPLYDEITRILRKQPDPATQES